MLLADLMSNNQESLLLSMKPERFFPGVKQPSWPLPRPGEYYAGEAAAAVQDGSVGSSAGAAAVQDDVGDWNLISRDQLSTY